MDMAHGSIGHAVAIRPHPFSAPNRLLASYPFKTQPTIRASRAPCAEPGIQVPICREPALAAGMARHERVFQPVSCGPPALVGADGSLAPAATGRVTDARRGRPLAPQPAIRSGASGRPGCAPGDINETVVSQGRRKLPPRSRATGRNHAVCRALTLYRWRGPG
jgi:hypothetical protein